MFTFTCPRCGHKSDYAKLEAGQQFPCPNCTWPITVKGSPEEGGFSFEVATEHAAKPKKDKRGSHDNE